MLETISTGKRFFTDDEWKQIQRGWTEIHEDTVRTLRKAREDYRRGSKTRRRLDAAVKHENPVFDFDLCVLKALQDMDRILHPAGTS